MDHESELVSKITLGERGVFVIFLPGRTNFMLP